MHTYEFHSTSSPPVFVLMLFFFLFNNLAEHFLPQIPTLRKKLRFSSAVSKLRIIRHMATIEVGDLNINLQNTHIFLDT